MGYAGQQWQDIGPAEITFGDTPAVLGATVANPDGGTHGGVAVSIAHEERESFRDAQGGEPYDNTVTAQKVRVRANLTGMSLEQLQGVIPGATLSTGPTDKALSLGTPVGTSMRTNAQPLIIKPIIDGAVTTDESKWINAELAFPFPNFEFAFDYENQKVFNVEFYVYRDTNGYTLVLGKDAA